MLDMQVANDHLFLLSDLARWPTRASYACMIIIIIAKFNVTFNDYSATLIDSLLLIS
jgi:hypothetical protein